MIFKLGFRNIKEKPFKTIGIILVVAMALAIIFSMLSYNESVENFIYATQRSESGLSDITISYRSDSPGKFFNTNELETLKKDTIESAYGALSIYANFGKEEIYTTNYGYVRGFENDYFLNNNQIKIVEGDFGKFLSNVDQVIISKSTAEKFNLDIGSVVKMKVNAQPKEFYVKCIAENFGIFAKNSPYVFVAKVQSVTDLLANFNLGNVYNQIFVNLKDGVSKEDGIKKIKALPQFEKNKVEVSLNKESLDGKIKSLTAPISIVGVAVVFLCLFAIISLFASSKNEKQKLISKLKTIGATNAQLTGIIAVELSIIAFLGVAIGIGMAVGVYALLLKWTLGSVLVFKISAWKLILSAILGFFVTLLSGFAPLIASKFLSLREGLTETKRKNIKIEFFVLIGVLLLLIPCLVLMFVLQSKIAGLFGLFSFVLLFVFVVLASPFAMQILEKVFSKSKNIETRLATKNLAKIEQSQKTMRLLSLAVLVTSILLSSYFLTTSIFSSFQKDFEEMIFVANVPNDNESELISNLKIDGVENAVPIVWKQTDLSFGNKNKTVTLIGADEIFDILDFDFQTPKTEIAKKLKQDKNFVFIDKTYSFLYGLKVGDKIQVSLENQKSQFEVGGIVEHRLFSGNYIVIAREQIKKHLNIPSFDTVLLTSKNPDKVVKDLRLQFSQENYFVIKALDIYNWDIKALDKVFLLLGLLGVLVAIVSAFTIVSNTSFSRAMREKQRAQLMIAGMSKSKIFVMEIFEHLISAVVVFVLVFGLQSLITLSLIKTLLLFDLMQPNLFVTLPVFVVSFIMCVGYAILPIVMNFRKRYNINGKGIN